jgi:hypothetical protein
VTSSRTFREPVIWLQKLHIASIQHRKCFGYKKSTELIKSLHSHIQVCSTKHKWFAFKYTEQLIVNIKKLFSGTRKVTLCSGFLCMENVLITQAPVSNSNSSAWLNPCSPLTHSLTHSLTNQLLFTSLTPRTNCPAYNISARTSQKTTSLCCCLTTVAYLFASRSLPDKGSTCHYTFSFCLADRGRVWLTGVITR